MSLLCARLQARFFESEGGSGVLLKSPNGWSSFPLTRSFVIWYSASYPYIYFGFWCLSAPSEVNFVIVFHPDCQIRYFERDLLYEF